MKKGIIFDFDGTLFDTNDLIKEGLIYSIDKKLGHKPSKEELIEIWGLSLEEQFKYFSKTKYKDIIEIYRDYYMKNKKAKKLKLWMLLMRAKKRV